MITSLSFDDILIKPKFSNIKSRKDIDLSTQLSYNISLKIPIISSPMDTVTEDKMAIQLAMLGGLGIIHRFQTIESQVDMVKRVKRHMSYIIENPYTINYSSTVHKLKSLMSSKNVSGILVVDQNNTCVGIVSKKDIDVHILSSSDFNNLQVKDIMTPFEKLHFIRNQNLNNYTFITSIFRDYKIEKIPILDDNNKILGLIVLKNLIYFYNNKNIASLDFNGQLLVGAAIGVNNDYIERATALVSAGVNILCIDVANGHNSIVGNAILHLKTLFPNIPIMAGNVCTAEGFQYLCEHKADCIRVGIGNGSICTTRLETGIGMCQFSALLECSQISKKYNVPMISDGGHCGKTGNKFKAIAIGASCVMLGKSLAGTSEAPGHIIYKSGKRYKYYRGMASALANISKQERQGQHINTNFHVEGVEGEIEYKGTVIDVIKSICNGIRSGMSYLGTQSISELHNSPIEFTTITSNGFSETKTRI
jgi:IMP dehydrogenase